VERERDARPTSVDPKRSGAVLRGFAVAESRVSGAWPSAPVERDAPGVKDERERGLLEGVPLVMRARVSPASGAALG